MHVYSPEKRISRCFALRSRNFCYKSGFFQLLVFTGTEGSVAYFFQQFSIFRVLLLINGLLIKKTECNDKTP